MLSHSRWCSPTLFRCIIPLSFANWSCFVWVLFAPPTRIDFFHCDLNGAIIRPLRPGEHDSCIKMPPFMLGSLNPLGQGMQNNGLQKNSIFGKYSPFFVSFCKSFCTGKYKCCLAGEEKNFEGRIKRKNCSVLRVASLLQQRLQQVWQCEHPPQTFHTWSTDFFFYSSASFYSIIMMTANREEEGKRKKEKRTWLANSITRRNRATTA